MTDRLIIWDNDGTVKGSLNPNDHSMKAKVILPNVERSMKTEGYVNIICSGCATPESEKQNFDPESVAERFKLLMEVLPIDRVLFSPTIGGMACYLLEKDRQDGHVIVKKMHEDPKYVGYVGRFKKPDVGMVAIIKDLAFLKYGIPEDKIVMIGDTWHDEEVASRAGIKFLAAQTVHKLSDDTPFCHLIDELDK